MSPAAFQASPVEESNVLMSPNALSIRLRIPAERDYLNNAILTLQGICEHVSIPNARTLRIVLALEESLLNSFEHAYQETGGVVDVEFSVRETELSLVIEDYGCGIPDGSCNAFLNDEDILCDRGRGLNIINTLPDKVTIDTNTGRGTRTFMLFNLAKCV